MDGQLPETDMSCFHNWFRPALLRWLQMSRVKTTLLLKKAVEVDQMKSVDEIVKHTSSAVDTMGCLDGISIFSVFTVQTEFGLHIILYYYPTYKCMRLQQ